MIAVQERFTASEDSSNVFVFRAHTRKTTWSGAQQLCIAVLESALHDATFPCIAREARRVCMHCAALAWLYDKHSALYTAGFICDVLGVNLDALQSRVRCQQRQTHG